MLIKDSDGPAVAGSVISPNGTTAYPDAQILQSGSTTNPLNKSDSSGPQYVPIESAVTNSLISNQSILFLLFITVLYVLGFAAYSLYSSDGVSSRGLFGSHTNTLVHIIINIVIAISGLFLLCKKQIKRCYALLLAANIHTGSIVYASLFLPLKTPLYSDQVGMLIFILAFVPYAGIFFILKNKIFPGLVFFLTPLILICVAGSYKLNQGDLPSIVYIALAAVGLMACTALFISKPIIRNSGIALLISVFFAASLLTYGGSLTGNALYGDLETKLTINQSDVIQAGNITRTNFYTSIPVRSSPEELWKLKHNVISIGGDNNGILTTQGLVFTPFKDKASSLCKSYMALGANSADVRWSLFESRSDCPFLTHTPAISNNIIVYNSFDGISAKFMPNGAQKWHKSIKPESSPLIKDGVVYVAAMHNSTTGSPIQLYALDLLTGKELWNSTIPEGYRLQADSKLAASDEALILVTTTLTDPSLGTDLKLTGYINYFDLKTGQLTIHETEAIDSELISTSAPLVDGQNLYVRIGNHIYVKDLKSGKNLGSTIIATKLAIGQSPPDLSVDKDSIYISGLGNNFLSLTKDFKEKYWITDLGSPVTVIPVVTATTIYTATTSHVIALDVKTGKVLWKKALDSNIVGNLELNNGVLYYFDNEYIYALK